MSWNPLQDLVLLQDRMKLPNHGELLNFANQGKEEEFEF